MENYWRRKTCYKLYPKEEADEKGIDYLPWREVKEKGGYALLDDGWVVPVTIVSALGDDRGRINYKIYTPVAEGFTSRKKPLVRGDIRSWEEKELGTSRTKRTIQTYVSMLLANGEIDWDLLGQIYRPDEKIPAATVKRLFKKQKIRQKTMEELLNAMNDFGVTDEYIIETLKSAVELGKQKGDVGNLLKAVEQMIAIRHPKETKKTTETLQIDSSLVNLIEGAEEEKRKITATRAIEEPLKEETDG